MGGPIRSYSWRCVTDSRNRESAPEPPELHSRPNKTSSDYLRYGSLSGDSMENRAPSGLSQRSLDESLVDQHAAILGYDMGLA